MEYLIACGAGTGWNICYVHANEVCPTGYTTLSEDAGFNRKAEASANDDRKSAIVTAKSKRLRTWADDGQETPPEIKARSSGLMLGRGPSSST